VSGKVIAVTCLDGQAIGARRRGNHGILHGDRFAGCFARRTDRAINRGGRTIEGHNSAGKRGGEERRYAGGKVVPKASSEARCRAGVKVIRIAMDRKQDERLGVSMLSRAALDSDFLAPARRRAYIPGRSGSSARSGTSLAGQVIKGSRFPKPLWSDGGFQSGGLGVQITLTPEQEEFVRQAVSTGRLHCAEDVVKEALSLWQERERGRAEFLASLDEADASLNRGEGIPVTEASMRALAEDVKRRGRERIAAEQPNST
jgi:antitoxin ParD1/3/4